MFPLSLYNTILTQWSGSLTHCKAPNLKRGFLNCSPESTCTYTCSSTNLLVLPSSQFLTVSNWSILGHFDLVQKFLKETLVVTAAYIDPGTYLTAIACTYFIVESWNSCQCLIFFLFITAFHFGVKFGKNLHFFCLLLTFCLLAWMKRYSQGLDSSF